MNLGKLRKHEKLRRPVKRRKEDNSYEPDYNARRIPDEMV